MTATKVKDYLRFTIYKSNDPNDHHPFFAEGKSARGTTVAAEVTLLEIEKKLDEYK